MVKSEFGDAGFCGGKKTRVAEEKRWSSKTRTNKTIKHATYNTVLELNSGHIDGK